MIRIHAPVSGQVTRLNEVPDRMFSSGKLGPGLAINPPPSPSPVLAPVSGTVIVAKPHAYVVQIDEAHYLLVHLGLDTVKHDAAALGLTTAIREDQVIRQDHELGNWDPGKITAAGCSPLCIVVLLEVPPGQLQPISTSTVVAGGPFFTWQA